MIPTDLWNEDQGSVKWLAIQNTVSRYFSASPTDIGPPRIQGLAEPDLLQAATHEIPFPDSIS
jgi:hypothetical protein